MFSASCPACHASLVFRSPVSMLAVCGQCRAVVGRMGEQLETLGTMPAPQPDDSTLRIGYQGHLDDREFTVIGRIQLQRETLFNQWFVLFQDGGRGWLLERGGQRLLLRPDGQATDAAPFTALEAGDVYRHDSIVYQLDDRLPALVASADGELPCLLSASQVRPLAIGRAGTAALTLDYGDGYPPARAVGRQVEPGELQGGSATATPILSIAPVSTSTITPVTPPIRSWPAGGLLTACPGCGAEVAFRSAASVMAVCPYCQTTVLKDAASAQAIGKMSSVLEDYSPFQLGVSGVYQGEPFTLVGRIQLRYEDGLWNEWYALFDDGEAGWLSDASGQYVFTRPDGRADDAPPFEQLQPLKKYRLYVATDVRTAACVAGEGELPFQVGAGWPIKVADFRIGDNFLTLDYTDGFPPLRFVGKGVSLDALKCQLLRDPDAVRASQYRGEAKALGCPNCGSPIDYAVEQARHIVCPACHAEVELSADTATVLRKHDELETFPTLLKPGEVGTINGQRYTVIGLLRVKEVGEESSTWIEYLLHNPEHGFLWLVKTDDGWQQVTVLNELPDGGDNSVRYQGRNWAKQWTYQERVIYAAGAFNWRVKIGDETRITDYQSGSRMLSAEQTANEVTWSLASPVSEGEVRVWFGKGPAPSVPSVRPAESWSGLSDGAKLFFMFTILLWLINLPLIMFLDGSLILTALATVPLFIYSWSVGDDDGVVNYFLLGVIVIVLTTWMNLNGVSGGSGRSWSSGSGSGWSSGGGHK